MTIEITRIRHRWAEKRDFNLDRPQGANEYILLHFLTQAELTWNGQTCRTQCGDLIVFSPGTAHRIFAVEPLYHNWMHLKGDVAQAMACYGLEPDVMYRLPHPSGLTDLIATMENEFFAQRAFWPELANAKVNEMFIRIARCMDNGPVQPTVRVETVERLREIRTRMLSEPWRNWSIAELAEDAHISESRLHAVYKSVFGVPPKHDLILMKIEKAKRLLNSGISVAETAEMLGYSNVFHFIRQFRQLTGVSPKQYHGQD